MSRNLKARLKAGELLYGTLLSFGATEVADLLAGAGFDWLFIDAEHGALDPRDVLMILQTVAGRTPCLVRVPILDEAWIKRALDAGADGVIVPQVSTAEQAERAVKYAHFAPRGTRGLGTSRANRYGNSMAGVLDRAKEQTMVVVQAESGEAIKNIEAIARVSDLDAVFVGPFDLSASLGRPGEVDHPEVKSAIARVAQACKGAGVRTGIFALGAAGLRTRPAEGFTLLAAGVDSRLLGGAVDSLLQDLKREVV